jgi:hypothetical protein
MKRTALLAAIVFGLYACKDHFEPKKDPLEEMREYVGQDSTKAVFTLQTDSSYINWSLSLERGGVINGKSAISSGGLLFEDGAVTGGFFTIDAEEAILIDSDSSGFRKPDWAYLQKVIPRITTPSRRFVRWDFTSANTYITRSDFLITPERTAPLEPTHTISGRLTIADSSRVVNMLIRQTKLPQKVLVTGRYSFPYSEWGLSPDYAADSTLSAYGNIIDCDFRLIFIETARKK